MHIMPKEAYPAQNQKFISITAENIDFSIDDKQIIEPQNLQFNNQMIVNSTRRLIPLTLRMTQLMSATRIGNITAKKTTQSAVRQLSAYEKQLVNGELKQFKDVIEELNQIQINKAAFNIYDDNGRRIVILSNKTEGPFPIWNITAGGAFLALIWQIWIGTFSYAAVGLTGVVALILSREYLYRYYKRKTPEITQVWINKQNKYQIKVFDTEKAETLIVEKDLFKFGLSSKVHPLYNKTINFMSLNKFFPDRNSGYWCTIEGKVYWLSANATINNILLHSLS